MTGGGGTVAELTGDRGAVKRKQRGERITPAGGSGNLYKLLPPLLRPPPACLPGSRHMPAPARGTAKPPLPSAASSCVAAAWLCSSPFLSNSARDSTPICANLSIQTPQTSLSKLVVDPQDYIL